MNVLNDTLDSVFNKGPVISALNCAFIGNALILAPHPDDESLACGGTIAMLKQNGFSVHVIFITDGTMSHPNSKTYPSDKLRILREKEARKALNVLGVPTSAISFFRLPDSKVNKLDDITFQKNSRILQDYICEIKPNTIFLPWRSDPHPDHIATWNLSMDAIKNFYNRDGFLLKVLEYPVWFWERTEVSELTQVNGVNLWKVMIEKELDLKRRAIFQHESQLGRIIKDDPNGFALSDSMLENFSHPQELFFEYNDFKE